MTENTEQTPLPKETIRALPNIPVSVFDQESKANSEGSFVSLPIIIPEVGTIIIKANNPASESGDEPSNITHLPTLEATHKEVAVEFLPQNPSRKTFESNIVLSYENQEGEQSRVFLFGIPNPSEPPHTDPTVTYSQWVRSASERYEPPGRLQVMRRNPLKLSEEQVKSLKFEYRNIHKNQARRAS